MKTVTSTCRSCLATIRVPYKPGRMREYCSQSCRQRAYEVRKAQRQLLGDHADPALGRPGPAGAEVPPLPVSAWEGVLRQLRRHLRADTTTTT
ncbi:MAG: hypothetical protein ACRD0P_28700, partial [Stackebrandtia sp.]